MKFTLLITPKATPRPIVTRNGVHYPRGYHAYKDALKLLSKTSCRESFEGTLKMTLEFYMPIPASFSKKKQVALVGTYHASKPDCDNLAKGVMDALEGVAYKNDSQVVHIDVKKIYSPFPRIEVELCEIQ